MSDKYIKVDWNYGSINNTPNDDSHRNAIVINDAGNDAIEIGIEDIDGVIEDLLKMKEEWQRKDWITELPYKFKFKNGNILYYAIKHSKDVVFVMWEIDGALDGIAYTEEMALSHINNKSWVLQE